MTLKVKAKVRDVFKIFVEMNTDTLCLTPKNHFNKALMSDAQLFSGERPLDHIESDGTLYLGISRHATCTTVGDCNVEFEYDGELPEIPEEYVHDY